MPHRNPAAEDLNAAFWLANEGTLLRDHANHWALIAGGRFQGAHATMDDGHAAGIAIDPREPFDLRWCSASGLPPPPVPPPPTTPRGTYVRTESTLEAVIRRGFLLPVAIGVDDVRAKAVGGVSRSVVGHLLIDTAAAETCLCVSVLEQLEIPYEGPRFTQDASGQKRDAGQFYCSMHFEGTLPRLASVYVSSIGFESAGVVGILGRSLLTRGAFTFDAQTRMWKVSW